MTSQNVKKLTYTDYSVNPSVSYPVQVDSAIRDEDGLKIKSNYAKKTEVGIQLTNVSATFNLQSTPDYAEYPYRAVITNANITSDTYVTVTFSSAQATSGNYSSICNTSAGELYLYANTNVGTVTIPTINLGGGPSNLTIDAVPTDGSDNAVSSNGVYDAINQSHIVLTNVSATFSSNSDTYSTSYPYRATIQDDTHITEDTVATVAFSSADASSGNYAPFCVCDYTGGHGYLYLYSKVSGTITVPTIDLGLNGGITTIDDVPTNGSYNPITSNAVYTNCVRTTGNQTISGVKTLTDYIKLQKSASGQTATQYVTNVAYSSGSQLTPLVDFYTNNGNTLVSRMYGTEESTTKAKTELAVYNPTNGYAGSLYLQSDNTGFSVQTTSVRAYDTNNTNDVVTIGMLNGLVRHTVTANDRGSTIIPCSYNSTNYCQLNVIMHSVGVCQILAEKVVNSAYTSSQISYF